MNKETNWNNEPCGRKDCENCYPTPLHKDMKTFMVYRTKAKEVVNEIEKSNYNEPDAIQFEGVEFWDKTVAVRWHTETRSMSFWNSMEDLKKVHIYAHPDYGTRVEWSDGQIEQL